MRGDGAYRGGSSNNALVDSFFVSSRALLHLVPHRHRTKKDLAPFHAVFPFYKYGVLVNVRMSPFGPRATPGTRSGIPWYGRPYMYKRRYFGQAALALASTLLLSACSSDTPTSPATASKTISSPDSVAEPHGGTYHQPQLPFPHVRILLPR